MDTDQDFWFIRKLRATCAGWHEVIFFPLSLGSILYLHSCFTVFFPLPLLILSTLFHALGICVDHHKPC